jgi:colanic acid biosynthesis glycosyl transferase WcaI
MRILVMGINYSPERTGIAPFTTGVCEHMSKQGHHVKVITAFPYYPEWSVWDGYRGALIRKETLRGVAVRRVRHFVPRRASHLLQRLAHDLSFSLDALLAGLFAGPCDLIYCACPPPTLGLTALLLSKLKRAPFVIKLADLASDAALATGILKEGPAIRAARAIEGYVYRHAEAVICLCQGFVNTLADRGISPQKLHLISDWADTDNLVPVMRENRFRNASGFSEQQFLVFHTGNMGKKQDLMNVVRAAELSQGESDLVWCIVGQGEERPAIESEIAMRNLKNIKLLPFQPPEMLSQMYSAADVLLLNQRAAVADSVIPSKLLTYMAAGRTVLAAVSNKCETARYVNHAQCGLLVHPEDPQALVEAVLSLRTDPALRQRLGANGRVFAQQHFTKEKVLQEYDRLFSRYADEVQAEAQASKKRVTAR